MAKESRAYLYNADRNRIIIKSIEIGDDIGSVGNSHIKIIGHLDNGDISLSKDDIDTFLAGDLSELSEEYDIVIAANRSKLSNLQHIANTYTGYVLDPVYNIDSDNNQFTIYIKKTNNAMTKVEKDREDILDLYDAIACIYETKM